MNIGLKPSQLGKIGAAKRWNKPLSEVIQANIDAGDEARAVVLAEDLMLFADLKPVVGDVIAYLGENWARKIPPMCEALLDASLTRYIAPASIRS